MIAAKDSTVICIHALQSVLWYRFYKLKNRLSSLRVGFFVAFSPVVCYNKKDTMQTIFPQPLQLGGDFLEIINQLATEFHLRKEQVKTPLTCWTMEKPSHSLPVIEKKKQALWMTSCSDNWMTGCNISVNSNSEKRKSAPLSLHRTSWPQNWNSRFKLQKRSLKWKTSISPTAPSGKPEPPQRLPVD